MKSKNTLSEMQQQLINAIVEKTNLLQHTMSKLNIPVDIPKTLYNRR